MTLPSGTITFLFTDIEGSTRLWEEYPDAMRLALARHDELLREAIERHNGYVFKTVGDAFCAAFSTAPDALRAALEAHLAFLEQEWGETGPIQVRMGLHTGEAEERDNDYFGQTLNRIARLQGLGHGQQTLLSQATCQLVSNALPANTRLQDMGKHRLKDLASPEQIWQLLHPALPAEFAPLKSLDYLPTNLPQQITSFIGREKQMEEVKQALQTTRLLTLTGSGGTGKTRLSLQVGADLLDEYKDGVWLVELAALSDPSLLSQVVSTVLHLREEPGCSLVETLMNYFQDKSLLLVLDNCEHLLDAAAQLADTLLKRCPYLRILATSREGLGISGELRYRVPALSLPDPEQPLPLDAVGRYESVQLFMERTLFHQPAFTLTYRNASAMVTVCHRLDGIPLAIELAAARVRVMPIEQIEARLEDRFRLLTGGSRTALPRQQTLKGMLDWSYDLLNAQEKHFLGRLSVFANGWTLEAAEQICAGEGIEEREVLNLLFSLVDKSLVVYEEQEGGGRYRLLETIRQYATERLEEAGQAQTSRKRHRDCFLALARQAASQFNGPEQGHWLDVLEAENDNLRAALNWCLLEPNSAEEGLELAGNLVTFWHLRSFIMEGRWYLNAVLNCSSAQAPTVARAQAFNGAGTLATWQGDYASASTFHEQSLAIQQQLGNRRGMAASLHNMAVLAQYRSDYQAARRLYEEALAINRERGHRAWEANNLNGLGLIAFNTEEYEQARVYFEQSLAIRQEIGDQTGIGMSLSHLGNIAQQAGIYAKAQALFVQSLSIRRDLRDKPGISFSLRVLAWLAMERQQPERAVRLIAATDRVQEEIGTSIPLDLEDEYRNNLAVLEGMLGQEAFDALYAEGRSMTLEQAIVLALQDSAAEEPAE